MQRTVIPNQGPMKAVAFMAVVSSPETTLLVKKLKWKLTSLLVTWAILNSVFVLITIHWFPSPKNVWMNICLNWLTALVQNSRSQLLTRLFTLLNWSFQRVWLVDNAFCNGKFYPFKIINLIFKFLISMHCSQALQHWKLSRILSRWFIR